MGDRARQMIANSRARRAEETARQNLGEPPLPADAASRRDPLWMDVAIVLSGIRRRRRRRAAQLAAEWTPADCTCPVVPGRQVVCTCRPWFCPVCRRPDRQDMHTPGGPVCEMSDGYLEGDFDDRR